MKNRKSTNIQANIQAKAFSIMADTIEKAGLKIEDNFRVSDEGIGMTYAATKAIARTGFPMQIPGNKSLKGMGIDRSGGFLHPLSETYTPEETGIDDSGMNLWGSASVFISVAMGWMEGDPAKAKKIVKALVSQAAPNISAELLMKAARYSDADLLKLTELCQRSLEASFDKAFKR